MTKHFFFSFIIFAFKKARIGKYTDEIRPHKFANLISVSIVEG